MRNEPSPPRAPGELLQRLSGPLDALVACGVARRVDEGLVEIYVDDEERTRGGMITISMRVPVRCSSCLGAACARCGGTGAIQALYSAWLALRPGVADGTVLEPSASLPDMLHAVSFRVRVPAAQPGK
jgi:hypothetical protein